MASPVQTVAAWFGLRSPDGEEGPPKDERTLLQVMLGNLFIAAVAGGIYALFGGDAVEAIAFGVLMYVLFLFLDLRNRRLQRERDEAPPPT